MIEVGENAPRFERPGVVDGDYETIALDQFLGEDVVIIVFYPADFNPACTETTTGFDQVNLFAMQRDVTILGIAPDSVYSHRAFADQYDLDVRLLADTDREVARQYGVTFEDDHGQALLKRAVFVIDMDGVVQYAWSSDDVTAVPPTDPIREAVADCGGDALGLSRYRVGHAHYVEGRRSFTSAMDAYESRDWMLARSDFTRARDEFEAASEDFDRALRFIDASKLQPVTDQARSKAHALWQVADWLAESADAFSSGNGSEGQSYREDAETPLETARQLGEPVPPDDIVETEGELQITTDVDVTEGGEDVDTRIDLDVDNVELDDDTETQQTSQGPQTGAAKRAREFGGVGMDMGDPDGADTARIEDALESVDDERGVREEMADSTGETDGEGIERESDWTGDPTEPGVPAPTSGDEDDGPEQSDGDRSDPMGPSRRASGEDPQTDRQTTAEGSDADDADDQSTISEDELEAIRNELDVED